MPELDDVRASLFAQLKRPRTIVGAVFLAISAAIVVNGLLQPGPHPAPFFSTREVTAAEAARGDELVRAVQDALKQIGYYGGALDGIAGPRTQSAILAFEAKAGRKPTGQASRNLLAAIRSMSAPFSTGSLPTAEPLSSASTPSAAPDALVAAVQNALALSAYGPLTADGVVGPQTRDAIMRFQRDHNLPVTGEISDGLVVELRATGAMHDG